MSIRIIAGSLKIYNCTFTTAFMRRSEYSIANNSWTRLDFVLYRPKNGCFVFEIEIKTRKQKLTLKQTACLSASTQADIAFREDSKKLKYDVLFPYTKFKISFVF